MIICPNRKIAFVHVPKCAGTSIRHQLRACDPDHIFLGQVGNHPVLGRIDRAHIRLPVLAEHFPDHYAWLLREEIDSFAVVRDPLDRFGSALRQLLWQYEQTPMTLIPQDELREKTLRLLDEVAAGLDDPPHRLIFFARQIDYIALEGRQVVGNLVPVDLAKTLIAYFARRTGQRLDTERRSNQNVELKAKWMGGMAYGLNRTLRRALPPSVHGRLKRVGLSLLAKKDNAAAASGILDLPEIRAFVSEHYAADQRLYARVEEARPAIAAALAETRLHPVQLDVAPVTPPG